MESFRKIILVTSLFTGYQQLVSSEKFEDSLWGIYLDAHEIPSTHNTSQSEQISKDIVVHRNLTPEFDQAANDFATTSNNSIQSSDHFVMSKKQAEQAIDCINKKNAKIKDPVQQADLLVQQNYKTIHICFDILSLMNLPDEKFIKINQSTGLIENLPTIKELIVQSYVVENPKDPLAKKDLKVVIKALKTSLKAIDGAIDDTQYNVRNNWMHYNGVETELQKMKNLVAARLQEIKPSCSFFSSVDYKWGAIGLAGLAAIAGMAISRK